MVQEYLKNACLSFDSGSGFGGLILNLIRLMFYQQFVGLSFLRQCKKILLIYIDESKSVVRIPEKCLFKCRYWIGFYSGSVSDPANLNPDPQLWSSLCYEYVVLQRFV